MNRTNNSKTYYTFAGLNAYGVYTDFNKFEEAKCYIYKCAEQNFKSFDAAKRWATEKLLRLQPPTAGYVNIEPIEKSNWTYYRDKG